MNHRNRTRMELFTTTTTDIHTDGLTSEACWEGAWVLALRTGSVTVVDKANNFSLISSHSPSLPLHRFSTVISHLNTEPLKIYPPDWTPVCQLLRHFVPLQQTKCVQNCRVWLTGGSLRFPSCVRDAVPDQFIKLKTGLTGHRSVAGLRESSCAAFACSLGNPCAGCQRLSTCSGVEREREREREREEGKRITETDMFHFYICSSLFTIGEHESPIRFPWEGMIETDKSIDREKAREREREWGGGRM